MGKRHIIGWTAAIFLIAAVLLPGLQREVEASEISDFDNYVTSIEELTVPEGTRIIALGEATHGNREFQQLKREVFEILVRKYDVRALVIEGDCGGCTIINEYIQGGEGDDRELTKLLGYRLYRDESIIRPRLPRYGRIKIQREIKNHERECSESRDRRR